MGKDTDELFSELTKAKTDKELKTFYERNEEELQHPDAVACLEQLFAKHKLKKADVILNTGLERTFAYHLLAGRKTFTRDKLLIFAIAAHLYLQGFFATRRVGVLHNVDYSFLKGQIETHCQWHVKTNLLSNGIDKFVQLWNSFDVVRQGNLSFYRRICLYVSHLLLI